jgi:hypothetical protein
MQFRVLQAQVRLSPIAPLPFNGCAWPDARGTGCRPHIYYMPSTRRSTTQRRCSSKVLPNEKSRDRERGDQKKPTPFPAGDEGDDGPKKGEQDSGPEGEEVEMTKHARGRNGGQPSIDRMTASTICPETSNRTSSQSVSIASHESCFGPKKYSQISFASELDGEPRFARTSSRLHFSISPFCIKSRARLYRRPGLASCQAIGLNCR